jgi:hypothetical protein
MMVRCARILQCAFVAVVFQSFVGCSSSAPVQPRQWNPTPIEDVKLVAGMWEGILIQAPRLRQDDWVRVFIRENGSYEFVGYRTIGVFKGKGTFELIEGKLIAQTDQGKIVAQLYTDPANGEGMLKVEGAGTDGKTYWSELTRAKPRPSSGAGSVS